MSELTLFQNTLRQYLYFFLALLLGAILIIILKVIILKRIKAFTKKTKTDIDEFLVGLFEKMALPLLCYSVFYLSSRYLTLSPGIDKAIKICGMIFVTIQGIRSFIAIVAYAVEKYWVKRGKLSAAVTHNFKTLMTIFKIFLWGVGIVFLLDNLGFKISAVLAGLGIGGIAVALAAQTILADLFSYFAIFFDKPFEVGDFIVIGDFLGTIEHIGIKSTRIRSLGGEQIVFSNSDLTGSRLRNYKRMAKRRVVFTIGVTYQTRLTQLKEIPDIIKNVIENIKDTIFDRAHFFSFADSSLVFEVAYYVLSQDYNKYMDIQQEINFGIKEELEKRGIEFAYPTQTLYVNKQL
ncbi:MAG: mechanosensitive ion channel family protein [Candidatus Omnitrophica bacterium]|jgi:small-conductance mechanosensitive channel|nr:mechanosensitive ion channel family protein [Candidatus Omnitrophota bacterium]